MLNWLYVAPKNVQGRSEVSLRGCIICGEFVTGHCGERSRGLAGSSAWETGG